MNGRGQNNVKWLGISLQRADNLHSCRLHCCCFSIVSQPEESIAEVITAGIAAA